MKKILIVLFITILEVGYGQKVDKLPYDRFEHILYFDGLGGNSLSHSYGYEFRYNPTNWMRIQAGLGLGVVYWNLLSVTRTQVSISPNTSIQFGKKWLWGEIGIEPCINLIDNEFKNSINQKPVEWKSGVVRIAPRAGVHFKFTRVFEFGFNYVPVFTRFDEGGYFFDKHWFSARFRFVMISPKKRKELGRFELKFSN